MSDTVLRSGLIRLAYANPDLRPALLPLIEKHAGDDDRVARVTKALGGLARLVASKTGGTAKLEDVYGGDPSYISAKAEVFVPNLPRSTAAGEDGYIIIEVHQSMYKGVEYNSAQFSLRSGAYGKYRELEDKITSLSAPNHPDLETAVQEATKAVPALVALLEPMREQEVLRRKAAAIFRAAVPDLKEALKKAAIQDGAPGPVEVWGELGTEHRIRTTEGGVPFGEMSTTILGLVDKSVVRDHKQSQAELGRIRKMLVKALARFSSNGVVAKLTSKPAYWSQWTYNTTIIMYFKAAPVPNMRLAGDMAAVLDAEADPTSHDQNLPEHYYFGKTAEERLENIEKLLSQFASPKSKDQNKPQSYYGLPPKGKQASVGRTAIEFPSEEALKQYLRDHPKADKKKHTVRVDPTYEKHHAKVESSMKNQYNDVMKHLADEGVTEDEAFADDYELMGLGRKWWSAQVKLENAKKSPDYAKLRGVLTDVKDIAGKMKARITELAKAKKGKKASVKTAGAHPLGRMAIVYFDLAMEDYNIEEDADNGDEFAQSLMADHRKGLELESKAVKNLSRMFGARIMDEGHDSGGGLVCKFGVDSWADVKKALDVINRNHEGGDDQIGTDVPYMVARDFRLYPDGVNDVFYGEGSGAEGDWDEWLSEHKGKQASVKTAGGSGAANAAYLRQSPLKDKILRAVAKHYGTSVSAIEAELTDPDAEFVFEYIGNDRALAMAVYRDMKAKGLA